MIPFKVIVTHGPVCPDGKYAELCAKYYNSINPYDNLIYWQVDPSHQLSNMNDVFRNIREFMKQINLSHVDVEVISFDVAFTPDIILTLYEMNVDLNISFDIYDHHISAIKGWEKFIAPTDKMYEYVTHTDKIMKPLTYRFTGNIEDCGATLSWKYFFPDQPIPLILEYVRIRDNWLFDKEIAKELRANEVNEYMNMFDVHEESESYFFLFNLKLEDGWFKNAIQFGNIIIKSKEKQIENMMKFGDLRELNNHKVYVINGTIYQSEIGNKAVESNICDYAIIWRYNELSKKYNISMRSKKGGVDVSLIAKKFGGGGHQAASGCEIDNFEDINKLFP